MKIALFGCSSVDGTPFGVSHPGIWPNLLAKDLDAILDNCFVGSGSNAAIFRKYCDYFQNDTADLCLIFWSFYMRAEIHIGETLYQITPGTQSFPAKYVDKFYGNQNLEIYKQELQNKIWCVDKICQKNNIPVLQGTAFEIDFHLNLPQIWFPNSLHSLIENYTSCGHAQLPDHIKIKNNIKNYLIEKKLV